MRELIVQTLTPDQCAQTHELAAQALAMRGDLTSAIDHLVRAGRYESALLAWLPHAEREIGRGNAAMALEVFARVPAARLAKSFADRLTLVRARLLRACGQPDKIVNTAMPHSADALALSDFLQELGWAHEQSGQLELALAAYTQSQQTLDQQLRKNVNLAASRTRLALRQRDLAAARREALRAAYEAERIQGVVHDEAGEPQAAQAHFLRALTHAETLDDADAIALTCNSLGVVAGRQADVNAAQTWLTRAAQTFEQLGNVLQAHIVRSNLVALMTTMGQHAEALQAGAPVLAFFQHLGHGQVLAATAASMAESAFSLGRLDEAERYAHAVIAQEEPQFVPYGLYTLGDVQRTQGQLVTAQDLFERALQMAHSNNDAYMQAYALRRLGQVRTALGEKEKGLADIGKANELFLAQGMAHEVKPLGN
jgi:tetratricopeptide (TPR) repeat protein